METQESNYDISVYDILIQILKAPDIRGFSKKNLLVRITPENGFNKSKGNHKLEDYLILNSIDYYFNGDRDFNEGHYDLNLRRINIIYDCAPTTLARDV